VFQFILTINASADQPKFSTQNGADEIEARKYLIQAVVGGLTPGTPQVNPETGTYNPN
jgi:hypothetical protein